MKIIENGCVSSEVSGWMLIRTMFTVIRILSILMVLIGAAFLFLSFQPARKIWGKVNGELRRKWLVILNLMSFFLLGYLFFDIVLSLNLPFPLELVTGGVFLGGAIFVYIIINLSQSTISARQKAEEDIQELNESLEQKVADRTRELKLLSDYNRTVLDCIADPISIIDVETLRIVDSNRAFLKVYNIPKEQIIGKTCYEVTHHRSSPCTPPDDICPLMETLLKSDHAVKEHVHWDLLNEKRYVEVLTSPIRDEKGKIIQAIHIQRDITERRRAEEELAFMNVILSTQKENSIDGILVVDESNTIISYNRRFIELWGIPPELMEAGDDGPLLQLVASRVAAMESFVMRVNYIYEHKEEICSEEILLKDGRVFDRFSTPMRGSEGKYYGRAWYFRDITERRKMQDELTSKVTQLETALAKVKQLEGIIPICSYCHKIRDDKESWHQLECYITQHSEAQFSHGICPECYAKEIDGIINMLPED